MIVSVHIPKCAGTSFAHFLGDVFKEGLCLHYPDQSLPTPPLGEIITPATRVIHGHFFADRFDTMIPTISYATWLRHPVDRLISHYEHSLRSPDPRDGCAMAVKEQKLDIVGFARMDWMRNQMSRYLAGKPLSAFAFVGVSEYFDRSLATFCAQFGLTYPAYVPAVNKNPAPASKTKPTEDQRRTLLELNALDVALYEAAVIRLLGEMPKTPQGA